MTNDQQPTTNEQHRLPGDATASQVQTANTTAGQRKVNLIWEYTQAFIAIVITLAIVASSVAATLTGKGEQSIPNILCAGFGLVIGTYFQRTNHEKIGGVREKPYEGR